MPVDFDIQLSDTNVDAAFATARSVTNFTAPASPADWFIFDFPPAAGRYLRLKITRTNVHADGKFYAVVAELQAFQATVQNDRTTLSWTATGDNGNTGAATSYDIRYSTNPITNDTDFNAATQVTGEPVPQPAGFTEVFTVTGLPPGSTIRFAIKVSDEKPNASGLSNVPTFVTPPGPPGAGADLSAENQM
jgi:hypothetical protein